MTLRQTALGGLSRFALAAAVMLGCEAWAQAPRGAAKSPAAIETLKERDQELDAVRTEQRKAAESQQKLAIENDSLVEEHRRLVSARSASPRRKSICASSMRARPISINRSKAAVP